MNTVSTPISAAIKIAGSQGKLAKMIGVHQTAISHFFLGRKRPSPEVAMRLQNAVNNQFQWYEFIGIEQGATQQEPQKNGSTDDASDTAQTSDGLGSEVSETSSEGTDTHVGDSPAVGG